MRHRDREGFLDSNTGLWRPIFCGLSASLVGIGLARFAYTPLIPALVAAHWFAPAAAVYLGAANFAGYLGGALLARPVAKRAPVGLLLRASMALATAAFFACAWPLSFLWFFSWRFASGAAGGALMALAAPAILPLVPPGRRGLAGGAIFTGVGLGIAASGTLVPLLLRASLAATWCGLGAIALLLTLAAWRGWPSKPTEIGAPAPSSHDLPPPPHLLLAALCIAYGLDAVGIVPHMVFLVDFVARGLHQGIDVGSRYWVIFGLGATAGPVLAGELGDRLGFRPALRLVFLLEAAVVALLAISSDAAALAVSSATIGAFTPGIVPLVLGRLHELLLRDDGRRQAAWSFCIAAFALGQAVAAYGFSFLFAQDGDYHRLFALGAAALMLASAIDLLAAIGGARRDNAPPPQLGDSA